MGVDEFIPIPETLCRLGKSSFPGAFGATETGGGDVGFFDLIPPKSDMKFDNTVPRNEKEKHLYRIFSNPFWCMFVGVSKKSRLITNK